MQFKVNDGVWVRLIDIEAALSARSYTGDGEIVLEVEDPFLPENAGRYRVDPDGAARTDAAPIYGSTSPGSARCISAASASPTSCAPRGPRS